MKTFSLFLVAILSSFAAFAQNSMEIKTLVTCEQTDGDQWIRVGISPYINNTYRMSIVLHNDDNGSSKLIKEKTVLSTPTVYNTLTFFDQSSTVKLFIDKNTKVGKFMNISNGPGSIRDDRMNCFFNSTISWNISAVPQPRISVGN